MPATRLLAAQEKEVRTVALAVLKQMVAGLLRERLEVAYRCRVGGENVQYLSARHLVERLLGAQDRQRAVQASRIDFTVELQRLFHPLPTRQETSGSPARAHAARPPLR